MIDLTQPSEYEDSYIFIATNHMSTHTKLFLPEFYTTSILQKGATTLESATNTDQPYKKEELVQYFTTVTGLN